MLNALLTLQTVELFEERDRLFSKLGKSREHYVVSIGLWLLYAEVVKVTLRSAATITYRMHQLQGQVQMPLL